MKHILVPIRVFEAGDRVQTLEGLGTVIYDEMEDYDRTHLAALSCSLESAGIEQAIEDAQMRKGIMVRLDEPTSKHPNVNEDYVCGRDEAILQQESTQPGKPSSKEFPDHPCERCGGTLYVRVPPQPTEKGGWECHQCGKGFIEDKVQPKFHPSSLSQSDIDHLDRREP